MKWLNIEISILRSPDYVGAEPVERATWLNLLAYCADQENGGIIRNCRSWKCRQWQQTCGITSAEAQLEAQLYQWAGDDLLVCHYPTSKEAELRAKREAGAKGGKASGRARSEAQLEGVLEAHLERKGKERKVKEKEVGRSVAEVSATNDTDWLKELAANPAYRGINIEAELGKMTAWCAANGKQRTRRRFVNWLNRAERPIQIAHNGHNGARKPATAWELKQSIEAAQKEASRLEGDPQNKEPIDPAVPWDRRLKPSVAAKIKELRGRAQELTGKLALLGKEAA